MITSATTASGTVGSAFSYQITATNTPTSYGATGLPAGLSVNTGTGLISGTPTAAATSTVTLSATNSAGTGNATLTLTITAAAGDHQRHHRQRDSGKRLLVSDHGHQLAHQLRRHGIAGRLVGEHRDGVDLGHAHGGGNIDGDAERDQRRGTGTATLTLTITAAPPVITSATTASGTVGSAFSYQITATNTPTSYGATGLPAGLSVNTGTGLISGTPTAAATSTVTLSATNSGGTGNATTDADGHFYRDFSP